jgi:hypothetical protein
MPQIDFGRFVQQQVARMSKAKYVPAAKGHFDTTRVIADSIARRPYQGAIVKYTAAKLIFGAAIVMGFASSGAVAQQKMEPTYKADPDVYKVIFEDDNFRVIEATRKKGVHDKPHAHPVPSVVYNVTDCKTKLYDGAGKVVREGERKAGSASASPVTDNHSAENTGTADCKQVFVEKKR